MNLSITKVLTYLDCPRKYWYLYELYLQTKKTEGFFFGSAVHEGLKSYYSGKDPMEGVENALFGKKDSLGEEAEEGVNLKKLFNDAKRIFEIYPNKAPYFEPLLVEHRFEVDLVNPETQEKLPATFVGMIDLITTDGNIIDHKTSKSLPNGFFKDKNDFQGTGYAYAFLRMFGRLPNSFVINNIVSGNSRREPTIIPEISSFQIGDICMFFDQCKYVLDAILRGETRDYPSRNNCGWCQFKSICSYSKTK